MTARNKMKAIKQTAWWNCSSVKVCLYSDVIILLRLHLCHLEMKPELPLFCIVLYFCIVVWCFHCICLSIGYFNRGVRVYPYPRVYPIRPNPTRPVPASTVIPGFTRKEHDFSRFWSENLFISACFLNYLWWSNCSMALKTVFYWEPITVYLLNF